MLRPWRLGVRLEWRSIPTAHGFDPYAATARALFRKTGNASDEKVVLAVMQSTPAGRALSAS